MKQWELSDTGSFHSSHCSPNKATVGRYFDILADMGFFSTSSGPQVSQEDTDTMELRNKRVKSLDFERPEGLVR